MPSGGILFLPGLLTIGLHSVIIILAYNLYAKEDGL